MTGQEFFEGVRIELKPAPVLKRLLATCVDMGIITMVVYVMFFPFAFLAVGAAAMEGILRGSTGLKELGGIGVILVLALFVLASALWMHAYFIYFESRTGATPGKKIFGLKVVSTDGQRLTRGQVIYRDLARWYLDALLIFPALIAMLASERRQRVGDLLAGTVVIHSRGREEAAADLFMYVKQDDYFLLREHLKPEPVAASLAESYLRFAYPAFIQNREGELMEERSKWLPIVRSSLVKSEELGLNDPTVLRFFAEYCLQTENERHTKTIKGKSKW